MANVLKMEKQILIRQLLSLGWSFRRIERETGIRRETISKYDLRSNPKEKKVILKPAKVPPDSNIQNRQPPTNCPPGNSSNRSLCAPFDAFIRKQLSKGLHAKRIYQDLVIEYHYTGGYDSVKRYVRHLKAKQPQVFARIHTPPGQEAQVDFGEAAPTLKNGRWVKPWLFKMVLSYSRHSYEEVVWRQDVETFIRCHEHAFEAFGGVVNLVRLDNLKSGVLKANLYDPELNPAYAAFAQHAGFVPLPCLPGKPEHKGKVESGIGYTQNNALKGRRFDSVEDQNAFLRYWNKTWARTRIHGTTKRQVWAVFLEEEKKALKPLADKPFQFFKIAIRTVHPDGHIEVDRAYYSVPHRFVGLRLTIHYNAIWVKAFYKNQRVAYHRKVDKGRFKTDRTHLPEKKSLSTEEYQAFLLSQCQKIGSECHLWAKQALKIRGLLALRTIQGVTKLSKSYSPNQSCM